MKNLIGQSIGRYRILGPLGMGGMATVYKAFDTQLERDVVIKFIRQDILQGENAEILLKRFKREARVLAKLSHPNILTLLDYGEHEGQLYLVTSYMPGGNLKERMSNLIPWEEAARLLAPIARALEYAHSQGILHRDIKPANILISPSGIPILADFGIAKIFKSNEMASLTDAAQTDPSQLTLSGAGIGTLDYMAPEQMHGQADQRSDIYSLGAVFYELVTGHRPYTGDMLVALLMLHGSVPLPLPREYVPSLPNKVEQVIVRALARRPEDRYQNIGEFAQILEALPWDVKSSEKRDSSQQPTKIKLRFGSKWSIRAAGAGLLAVVILALASAMIKGWLPIFPSPAKAPTVTSALTPTLTSAPTKLAVTSALTPTLTSTPTKLAMTTPTLDPAIQSALNEIRNNTPRYKTGFDSWGDIWQSDGKARIENGKLIADSQNLSFNGARENILASDGFAVTFDFRIQQSELDSGVCEFRADNGSYKGLDFQFNLYGQTVLYGAEPTGDWVTMTSATSGFNFSTSNTATIIILGNQIAAFINDRLMYTALDSRVGMSYRKHWLGANGAVCEFDNYKLWDLANITP
jgi:serine/threonine protein kinase